MRTHFVKYHGLGNDFVLVDRRAGGEAVTAEQAVRLCDRRLGIGADGVLTLLPGDRGVARMHVTNSDGSVAEMCGNGLRCAAKFLADRGGVREAAFVVDTGAGARACEVVRDTAGNVSEVRVDMGRPELTPSRIPMAVGGAPDRFVKGSVEVDGATLVGTAVSMGNPHLVLFETDASRAAELGPKLERHPMFPARTNVEFVRRAGPGLEVVVWERGSGFTQACGTGACASLVAAVLEGRLAAGEERPVKLPGGTLHVRVEADLSRVFMRGPAVEVFAGDVDV